MSHFIPNLQLGPGNGPSSSTAYNAGKEKPSLEPTTSRSGLGDDNGMPFREPTIVEKEMLTACLDPTHVLMFYMSCYLDTLVETPEDKVKSLDDLINFPYNLTATSNDVIVSVGNTVKSYETLTAPVPVFLPASSTSIEHSDSEMNDGEPMTALVLGATGAVGRCLVAELLMMPEIKKVTAIVRHPLDIPSEYFVNLEEEQRTGRLVVVHAPEFDREPKVLRMWFNEVDVVFITIGACKNVRMRKPYRTRRKLRKLYGYTYDYQVQKIIYLQQQRQQLRLQHKLEQEIANLQQIGADQAQMQAHLEEIAAQVLQEELEQDLPLDPRLMRPEEARKQSVTNGHGVPSLFSRPPPPRPLPNLSSTRFEYIDFFLCASLSTLARECNVPHLAFVSADGAGAKSLRPFLRSKGALEEHVIGLDFPHVSTFQPDLLDRGDMMTWGEKVRYDLKARLITAQYVTLCCLFVCLFVLKPIIFFIPVSSLIGRWHRCSNTQSTPV
jgi:hypothetical protein